MADSKWGRLYVQSNPPDGATVMLHDLWVDTDIPRLNVCTQVSPSIVWTPVNQAEVTGTLGGQTVSTVDVLGNIVALGGSTQTAINALQTKIDDIITKLKASGLMAS